MHKAINPKMFYYGFPVVLLTTCDKEGNVNITPISSSWCLGDNVVIGLGLQGKAFENLQICPEAVLNLPDESLWSNVEKIAPLTAKNPIPSFQQGIYQFCENKAEVGNFHLQPSTLVKPHRIFECPLQAEVHVTHISEREGYAIIELKIVQVHANKNLLLTNDKIDPQKWKPLIYNFRHYQGLTDTLGKNFRCE